MLNDRRNRITTPTQEEDDDEITRPATESQIRTRKYKRRLPSVVWGHVTNSDNDKIECNHCSKTWSGLCGSTSNPLKQLKDEHHSKLTDKQKKEMS